MVLSPLSPSFSLGRPCSRGNNAKLKQPKPGSRAIVNGPVFPEQLPPITELPPTSTGQLLPHLSFFQTIFVLPSAVTLPLPSSCNRSSSSTLSFDSSPFLLVSFHPLLFQKCSHQGRTRITFADSALSTSEFPRYRLIASKLEEFGNKSI